MQRTSVFGLSALLAVGGTAFFGCGKDSDRPKYHVIEGRIISIDQETGVVSMSYYSDKHNREMKLEGRLAHDAEIWINGVVTAKKEDLSEGDRVTVMGREEEYNGDRRLVATRVDITRPEPPRPDPSSLPAEHQEITGRITAIDLEAGTVSMSYYNEERKEETTLEAQLAPDAEVLIDGATAPSEDLRVGDRVTATGRQEDRDEDRVLVVTRIHVTRRHPAGRSVQ